MTTQRQVWDAIAPEWDKYKKLPATHVAEFLQKKSGRILDFGSGSGRYLRRTKEEIEKKTRENFRPNKKFYLIDFSKEMIKLAKERACQKNIDAECIVSNMTKLPFQDNFFDAAISISAIHCLKPKDHKKAIKELYRVLKPGAEVFVGVWNRNSKRFKNKKRESLIGWTDKGKRYYYLFTEDEIHALFREAGFEVLQTYNSEMMIRFVALKAEK